MKIDRTFSRRKVYNQSKAIFHFIFFTSYFPKEIIHIGTCKHTFAIFELELNRQTNLWYRKVLFRCWLKPDILNGSYVYIFKQE